MNKRVCSQGGRGQNDLDVEGNEEDEDGEFMDVEEEEKEAILFYFWLSYVLEPKAQRNIAS